MSNVEQAPAGFRGSQAGVAYHVLLKGAVGGFKALEEALTEQPKESTMTKEAMKQALELIRAWERGADSYDYGRDIQEAVTALEEALAQHTKGSNEQFSKAYFMQFLRQL